MPGNMKAILDDPSFGEEGVVYSCNAVAVRRVAGGDVHSGTYLYEAAGSRFFDRFERSRCSVEGQSRSQSKEAGGGEDAGDAKSKAKAGKDKGGILKLSSILKDVELYPLLGVSEGSSPEDIKKAYRIQALASHPDKLGQLPEEEATKVQENFVMIQEAYEILSNPAKRQLYDSSLPFDDRLPKYKEGQNFYEVFAPVFARNARFSVKKPVPDLGGPESPLAEVKRFYEFWDHFQSWRDPLSLAQADGEDMCDLEEAECREEKRWMMRENQRIGKKYKRAEQERVASLVNLAEKTDPRLNAEKDAKKAAKEAEIKRREDERMAKQRAQEEEERKLQEAAAAKKKAVAERKASKDAAKEELANCRTRVRSLVAPVERLVLEEQVGVLCGKLDKEALGKLGDDVEAALSSSGKEAAAALFYKALEDQGLKPVVPSEDLDKDSTSAGPTETSQEETEESRKRSKERQREEEERRREAEERRQAAAAKKAAERKRRAAAEKQEQESAEAKQRQQEKRETEKVKKSEEKKRQEEDQRTVQIQQQKEEARLRLEKEEEERQAAEAVARTAAALNALYEADREERCELLAAMSAKDLEQELAARVEADASLAGALHLLRACSLGAEDQTECLCTLLSPVGTAWPLALNPPAEVKPSNAVKSKVKKARFRLRDDALKFWRSLDESHGANKVAKVTKVQRGYINGEYEWPMWTEAGRKAELQARGEPLPDARAVPVVEEAPAAEAVDEAPAAVKTDKKAKDPKKGGGEEDFDALLAEFGVSAGGKKGRKKKQK